MVVGGSGVGVWCWSVLRLECVHRQITVVVHDYTCSLALKTSEPQKI